MGIWKQIPLIPLPVQICPVSTTHPLWGGKQTSRPEGSTEGFCTSPLTGAIRGWSIPQVSCRAHLIISHVNSIVDWSHQLPERTMSKPTDFFR